VLHRENKIVINYSDFRVQQGVDCPFKIKAKTAEKSLEVEFRKIDLE
jgi:hypothetical protein